ncbi:hypothetical protein K503DRAFT_223215 [Rhizopogon vinicolor AM-OR11-026]|uniref:Uncharacterized protein n=1 Tax=Rhizopogon vinicolor AM-OR11-026 TaxID=1314800 RepID=A0A1B7NE40_9AGAM|nr:hypothetical protein K503DRAFT_223215 [Rhizopogon vinicolor AM-OR11-026]
MSLLYSNGCLACRSHQHALWMPRRSPSSMLHFTCGKVYKSSLVSASTIPANRCVAQHGTQSIFCSLFNISSLALYDPS